MNKVSAVGFILGILMALVLAPVAVAQTSAKNTDLKIITGKEWTAATPDSKLAFLMGAGNVIEIEQALQQQNPPGDRESLVPVIVRGLSGQTLTQIMKALDRWYANNPNELDRPVLETIWFELALPNS